MNRRAGLVVAFLVACGPAGAPPHAPSNAAPDDPPPPGACPDTQACVDEGEQLRTPISTADDKAQARTDNRRALALFSAACDGHHPRGCEAEAEMLQDHAYYDVPKNDRRAARAWEQACVHGNAHACYRFGFYAWEGLLTWIVVEGIEMPYRWSDHRDDGIFFLQYACEHGEPRACDLLAELRASGQYP